MDIPAFFYSILTNILIFPFLIILVVTTKIGNLSNESRCAKVKDKLEYQKIQQKIYPLRGSPTEDYYLKITEMPLRVTTGYPNINECDFFSDVTVEVYKNNILLDRQPYTLMTVESLIKNNKLDFYKEVDAIINKYEFGSSNGVLYIHQAGKGQSSGFTDENKYVPLLSINGGITWESVNTSSPKAEEYGLYRYDISAKPIDKILPISKNMNKLRIFFKSRIIVNDKEVSYIFDHIGNRWEVE